MLAGTPRRGAGRASGMSNTSDLTFIVPCKGRLDHLRASLPRLDAQPNCDVVVVDSRCPDGAADWAAQAFPRTRVVRLDDGGKFNLSRCRNAGLKVCKTPWVCFIDADVVISTDFRDNVVPQLTEGAYYLFANFANRSDLTGTCIVDRREAERLEGYDEVFEAWGGRDRDFYMRLNLAGLRPVTLPNTAIDEIIAHSDDLRTTFYDRKDIRFSQSVSAMYRLAKFNILSNGGVQCLTARDRRHLYASAEQALRQAMQTNSRKAHLQLELPVGGPFAAALGAVRQTLSIEIDTARARR